VRFLGAKSSVVGGNVTSITVKNLGRLSEIWTSPL